ncbi:RAN GTPase-activating protein 1-like protein [Drosera capensis]
MLCIDVHSGLAIICELDELSSQSRPQTIKLWPPSPSTRIMLVDRITKNLMTPSIFSTKYGLLSADEADQDARQIEEMTFAFAGAYYEKEPDGD